MVLMKIRFLTLTYMCGCNSAAKKCNQNVQTLHLKMNLFSDVFQWDKFSWIKWTNRSKWGERDEQKKRSKDKLNKRKENWSYDNILALVRIRVSISRIKCLYQKHISEPSLFQFTVSPLFPIPTISQTVVPRCVSALSHFRQSTA